MTFVVVKSFSEHCWDDGCHDYCWAFDDREKAEYMANAIRTETEYDAQVITVSPPPPEYR